MQPRTIGVISLVFLVLAGSAAAKGAGELSDLDAALKAEIRAEVNKEVAKLREEVGQEVHDEVKEDVASAVQAFRKPGTTTGWGTGEETKEGKLLPIDEKHSSSSGAKHDGQKGSDHHGDHRRAKKKHANKPENHGSAVGRALTTQEGTYALAEGNVARARKREIKVLRAEQATNRNLRTSLTKTHALLAQLSEKVRKARAAHLLLKRQQSSSHRVSGTSAAGREERAEAEAEAWLQGHAARATTNREAEHMQEQVEQAAKAKERLNLKASSAVAASIMSEQEQLAKNRLALTSKEQAHLALLAAAERVHALEDARDQAQEEAKTAQQALKESKERLAVAEEDAREAQANEQQIHKQGTKASQKFAALQESYRAQQGQLQKLQLERKSVTSLEVQKGQLGKTVKDLRRQAASVQGRNQRLAAELQEKQLAEQELNQKRMKLEAGLENSVGLVQKEADLEAKLSAAKDALAKRTREAAAEKQQTDLLQTISSGKAATGRVYKEELSDAKNMQEKAEELEEELKEKKEELKQAQVQAAKAAQTRKEQEHHVDRYLEETAELSRKQEDLERQLSTSAAKENATQLEIISLKAKYKKLQAQEGRDEHATHSVLEQVRSEVIQLRDAVARSEMVQQNLALKVRGEEAVLNEKQKHRLGLLHRGSRSGRSPASSAAPKQKVAVVAAATTSSPLIPKRMIGVPLSAELQTSVELPPAPPAAAAAPGVVAPPPQVAAPASVEAFLNSPAAAMPILPKMAPAAKPTVNQKTSLLQNRKKPHFAEYRAEDWQKSSARVNSAASMQSFYDIMRKQKEHRKALGLA